MRRLHIVERARDLLSADFDVSIQERPEAPRLVKAILDDFSHRSFYEYVANEVPMPIKVGSKELTLPLFYWGHDIYEWYDVDHYEPVLARELSNAVRELCDDAYPVVLCVEHVYMAATPPNFSFERTVFFNFYGRRDINLRGALLQRLAFATRDALTTTVEGLHELVRSARSVQECALEKKPPKNFDDDFLVACDMILEGGVHEKKSREFISEYISSVAIAVRDLGKLGPFDDDTRLILEKEAGIRRDVRIPRPI